MNYIPEHFNDVERDFILDLYYGFGITDDIMPLLNMQIGGGESQVIQFIDVGGVYTYDVHVDDSHPKYDRISVLPPDQQACVTILMYKKDRLAILHNMSYYDDCAREGLGRPGGGNKLLRFALNLILNYKKKYNTNRIVLKDNSFLYCKGFEHTVKLTQLRMFTHGLPWYSSYGFKPYDIETQKPAEDLLAILKQSQKTVETIKTKQFDIIGIIKKEKLKIDIKEIQTLIDQYPLMKHFIIALTSEFNRYCRLIYYLLDAIYKAIPMEKLGNFHEKAFYLDI